MEENQPQAKVTAVVMGDGESLVIKQEITDGELLISVLLAVFIVVFVLKWIHGLIFAGRKGN